MNKSGTSQRNHDQRNEQIRHHCERISTHLAALKQLLPDYYTPSLTKIGKFVKRTHTKVGGHPDA